MFTLNVDLGQVIIATFIAVIGWLIGNKLSSIDSQLARHDSMILEIWKYLTSLGRDKVQ
jgi:hypothetical protein